MARDVQIVQTKGFVLYMADNHSPNIQMIGFVSCLTHHGFMNYTIISDGPMRGCQIYETNGGSDMKRCLVVLICLCITLVPMAAGAEQPELRAGSTLVVCASQDWVKDFDRELAQKFTDETGVKIDFQLNPNDQYSNIVKAKLASGDGVDIFFANPGRGLMEYAPDKYAYDLSDQSWIEGYTDWALESATYEDKVVFFSTGSMGGWGLLYNGDLLNQIGKEPATNYEELLEICEAFNAIGVTPFFEPGADTWHACVWMLETGDWLNRKYGDMYEKLCTQEGKYADYPEILTFSEQMMELEARGYFGAEEDWLGYSWNDRSEMMASGAFGMMVGHMAVAPEIEQLYPEAGADQWPMTIIPLAGNETFSNSGGSMGQVINKESDLIPEALAYFEFLSRPENTQYAYDHGTNPNITFESVTLRPNYQYDTLMASCNGITGADYTTRTPYYSAEPIGRVYVEMWIGDKTPEQAVAQIDKDRAIMFGVVE